MSEIRDIISDSIGFRLAYTGENCINQADGSAFVAEYEENPNLELREAMGIDPRESAKLHVADKVAAGKLSAQGKLKIQLYGVWNNFVILTRTNNPGSSQVDFGLMLVTSKDAQ